MEKKRLGTTGITVAPLAFGGNVFGWTIDESTSFQLLDKFVAAGFNLIDTADSYSVWVSGNKGGESETIIGRWLQRRGRRDDVVIATKVGWEIDGQRKGLAKDYIIKEVEESLKRLQTDYIDLYQAHKDDQETPLDETLEAFAKLLKDGKVRAIGASNYSGERLLEALKISKQNDFPVYQTLQPLYNLYDRERYEQELEPICEQYGLGVITYYSLASGFLSGKYREESDFSKSARGATVRQKYYNSRGMRIIEALDEVSKRYNCKPAQVALAWLMARPSVTAPIASATNILQLEEIMQANEIKLDDKAIKLLNDASAY